MKLTFLGTGSSSGIPILGCSRTTDCACNSYNLKDKRLRSSVYIESYSQKILIDAGPDLRIQFLREELKAPDALLLTHSHSDNILGLDDLKPFTSSSKRLPIFSNKNTLEKIENIFSHNFVKRNPNNTSNIAFFEIHEVEEFLPFSIIEKPLLSIIPIPLIHSDQNPFGYRIQNLAYLLDCKSIPQKSKKYLKKLDVLIITGIGEQEQNSHMNFKEALEIISELNPKITFFSHISHTIKHEDFPFIIKEILQKNHKLRSEIKNPSQIHLAYDGLMIEIQNNQITLNNSEWYKKNERTY